MVPVGTGEPTAVSCPELAILKAATVFATGSVTNRNVPLESMAIADPATVVVTTFVPSKSPLELNGYADTKPAPELITNRVVPVIASAVGPAAVDSGQVTGLGGVVTQLDGIGVGEGGGCLTSVNAPPV